jgi:hypothetical protein
MAFVPLLFPTGRLPSPRWRALAWVAGGLGLVASIAFAFEPTIEGPSGRAIDNPPRIDALAGGAAFGRAGRNRFRSVWPPGVPLACGIAILKHRLYDIDRFINRTILYTLLTIGLALAYAGVVVGLQQILGEAAGARR